MLAEDLNLYELLGVAPGSNLAMMRDAYRVRARELHPDRNPSGRSGQDMATLNGAWSALSDTNLSPVIEESCEPATHGPQPPPGSSLLRRIRWLAPIRAEIIRLGTEATKSAIRNSQLAARASDPDRSAAAALILDGLGHETEARVRAARASGAMDSELPAATILVGVRTLGDDLKRQPGGVAGAGSALMADLLGRIWVRTAKPLPHPLPQVLGGNPTDAGRR